MGSSGWQLPLVRLRDDAATNRAVRAAMEKTLFTAWDRLLRGELARLAIGWLSAGPDSLLKIQDDDAQGDVPDALTFWFYESVDWARHLAEHWLRHALAWERLAFEEALARLGFAVDPARWPNVVDVIAEAPHHFVDGARIGHVEGDQVRWVVDGTDDASPTSTPWKDLSVDLRARATALRACACPLCEDWPERDRPRLVAAEGHAIEPIWASSTIRGVLSSPDGTLIVHNAPRRVHAWTLRRAAADRGWTTIPTLTDEKRAIDALTVADGTYVAIMGYNSPKPPRVASTSSDRGLTWTPLAPTKLPEVNGPRFVSHPHRPRVVYAMNGRSPAKQLFRSDDGGRTFATPTAPTVAGAPQVLWQVVEFEGRAIVGARKSRTSPGILAVAEGTTPDFAPIDLGGLSVQGLWCSARGVLAAFGTVDGTPMVLRSHDEGRTWTASGAPRNVTHAHLGPRWFALEWRAGVYASDDEGATWARVVEGPVTDLAADAADSNAVCVTAGALLVRARTSTLAAHALPSSTWPQAPRAKKRRSAAG